MEAGSAFPTCLSAQPGNAQKKQMLMEWRERQERVGSHLKQRAAGDMIYYNMSLFDINL